ncbi:MAG: hypothetical protein M0R33_17085 [Methylomonas sp.]|jgi:hypothetical protein|uniref:hypothetical protein n=1 Tax=Methylomonas sp. TaxID=418 RepID=UPI0025D18CBB|nr:hypothetical protein [Methylomonas sp.]MCK9608161.1 hypothetical protein [Methylomonas sp.]
MAETTEIHEESAQSETIPDETTIVTKRGRPKKYNTPEERHVAAMESSKRYYKRLVVISHQFGHLVPIENQPTPEDKLERKKLQHRDAMKRYYASHRDEILAYQNEYNRTHDKFHAATKEKK